MLLILLITERTSKQNLMPVDYQISEYYNGSMEVVAVKTDRDMGQG